MQIKVGSKNKKQIGTKIIVFIILVGVKKRIKQSMFAILNFLNEYVRDNKYKLHAQTTHNTKIISTHHMHKTHTKP